MHTSEQQLRRDSNLCECITRQRERDRWLDSTVLLFLLAGRENRKQSLACGKCLAAPRTGIGSFLIAKQYQTVNRGIAISTKERLVSPRAVCVLTLPRMNDIQHFLTSQDTTASSLPRCFPLTRPKESGVKLG